MGVMMKVVVFCLSILKKKKNNLNNFVIEINPQILIMLIRPGVSSCSFRKLDSSELKIIRRERMIMSNERMKSTALLRYESYLCNFLKTMWYMKSMVDRQFSKTINKKEWYFLKSPMLIT